MSLESAPTYEGVFFYRLTTFDPATMSIPRLPNIPTYTEMEGIGNAFGGVAKRIILRSRTLYGYRREGEGKEKGKGVLREEVDIAPSYAPTHCLYGRHTHSGFHPTCPRREQLKDFASYAKRVTSRSHASAWNDF